MQPNGDFVKICFRCGIDTLHDSTGQRCWACYERERQQRATLAAEGRG